MFEKISDFFASFKERLSNPFIFSFIFSWLVTNWKIAIAFIYPDSVKNTGYSNLFEFIDCQLNFYLSFMIPIGWAFFYTFIFPMCKNWINIFQAWNTKWGNDRIFEESKNGKISVEKYLKIRETYDKRTKDLEDIIAKANTGLDDKIQFENALIEQQKKNNDTLEQLAIETTFRGQLDNSKFFEGQWNCIYEKGEEIRIVIEGNHIYEVGKLGERINRSSLRNFIYDNRYKRLQFLRTFDESKSFKYYDLTQEHSSFIGNENVYRKVRFEKPPDLVHKNEVEIENSKLLIFNRIFNTAELECEFVYETGVSKYYFQFRKLDKSNIGRVFSIVFQDEIYKAEIRADFKEWQNFIDRFIHSVEYRETFRAGK